MPTLELLGSTMHYRDSGRGRPVVFLHGNPQSSHVWRHVIAGMPQGIRVLAPDLIGMGRSGKPDIAYSFADHARYLDAWFEAMALGDVVLVGLDWGGSLAFDRAARHPDRVAGLVFMEAIVRPTTWDEFPAGARERFRALRTPGVGERLALTENVFIEQALRQTVLGGLSAQDLAVYAAPYPTPASRRPLLAWPRAWPIEGEPPDVLARFQAFGAWAAASVEVPKLLLTFDTSPTLLVDPGYARWCAEHMASLSVVPCGPAGHIAPEDQPDTIAAAITRWLGSGQDTGDPDHGSEM